LTTAVQAQSVVLHQYNANSTDIKKACESCITCTGWVAVSVQARAQLSTEWGVERRAGQAMFAPRVDGREVKTFPQYYILYTA